MVTRSRVRSAGLGRVAQKNVRLFLGLILFVFLLGFYAYKHRTPEPETAYQKAAQVWDDRIGSARVQARN